MTDADREPFVREERYIVIKRKYLSPKIEQALRGWLGGHVVATIECVVVESDWPEYETVWQMIEDRCTGTSHRHASIAPYVEALRALVKDFRWRSRMCRTNADAFDTKAAAVWDFAADAVQAQIDALLENG